MRADITATLQNFRRKTNVVARDSGFDWLVPKSGLAIRDTGGSKLRYRSGILIACGSHLCGLIRSEDSGFVSL